MSWVERGGGGWRGVGLWGGGLEACWVEMRCGAEAERVSGGSAGRVSGAREAAGGVERNERRDSMEEGRSDKWETRREKGEVGEEGKGWRDGRRVVGGPQGAGRWCSGWTR